MKRWRSTLALALGGTLIASTAFAQATTGTPPSDQPSSQAEKAKGAPTDTSGTTRQPTGAPSGDTSRMDAGKPDDRGKRAARGAGNREQVRAAQQALKDQGLYDADVDGIIGPKTREAIREFQKRENLKETGRLDAETLAKLGVERTGAAGTSPAASPRTAPGTGGSEAGTKTESGSSAASPSTTPGTSPTPSGPARGGERK
jgi:peptidoglycan hydrolase-like protein with peptidoglycan-binding domain